MSSPRIDTTSSASTSSIVNTLAQASAAKNFEKAKKIWAKSEVLISGEEYQARVTQIAKMIHEKYQGQPVILMSVLEGGSHMGNCLATAFKKLGIGYERTSISTASYGHGTTAGKEVDLKALNKISLKDRIVIVAEDIVDTANTCKKIAAFLQEQPVAAFEFVSGINKPLKRAKGNEGVNPTLAVLTTDDPGFCAGGGMDYFGFFRDEEAVHTADPKLFDHTPPPSPKTIMSLSGSTQSNL